MHLTGERVVGHKAEQPRHPDGEDITPLGLVADGKQRHRGRVFRLPQSLGRRHLHWLDTGHVLGLAVANQDHQYRTDRSVDDGHSEGAPEDLDVLRTAQEVEGGDAGDKESGSGHRRGDDVRPLHPHVAVAEEGEEIVHFGTTVAQDVAHGLLHEGVGDQYPKGREVGGDGHHPYHRGVCPLGQPVPTEDPDT